MVPRDPFTDFVLFHVGALAIMVKFSPHRAAVTLQNLEQARPKYECSGVNFHRKPFALGLFVRAEALRVAASTQFDAAGGSGQSLGYSTTKHEREKATTVARPASTDLTFGNPENRRGIIHGFGIC
jgi:hypothetical protein